MDVVPAVRPRLWKGKADFFRPFRNAAAEVGESVVPLFDPGIPRADPEDLDLRGLNTSLSVLVDLFPDVQPEVFREMLLSVSEESRVQIVTEHLLKKKTKWVRGRYRRLQAPALTAHHAQEEDKSGLATSIPIPIDQTFRSEVYKKAVKQVCYQEFKTLSHSSVKAVLAEQNFSYSLVRPILQQIASRSWRFSLSSLWPRRSLVSSTVEHPFVVWQSGPAGAAQSVPGVKRTGSGELDKELYDLFVAPVLMSQRHDLLKKDHSVACTLNEAEAEVVGATFDCECCYNAVTFEQLAVCDDTCHQLCFDCVRRTANEALFGQGWSRTVNLKKTTLHCFAPSTNDCHGSIPPSLLHFALAGGDESDEMWHAFNARAASEALAKSRAPLQHCPFCTYAEVNETPAFELRKSADMWHHVNTHASIAIRVMLLATTAALLLFVLPLVPFVCFAWLVIRTYPPATATVRSSWSRVSKQRRGLQFKCRNPHCAKVSCVRCLAHWRDIHTCFENEKTSLRTAIEASATAAVKRTCPKCMLSFIKASGCNKLVCNCGYTMCYVCRQEITSKVGYSHFCQHFRPLGGRCLECERCDLYGDEDEEAVIRDAAAVTEQAWREKEGGRDGDVRTTQAMVDALVGPTVRLRYWEVWSDAVIDAVAA